KGVKRPKNKPPISKITPIQRNKLRALKVLALAKANGFFAAGVPYGFDPAEGQQDTDIVLLAPVGMPTSACQAIMRGATAIDGESIKRAVLLPRAWFQEAGINVPSVAENEGPSP